MPVASAVVTAEPIDLAAVLAEVQSPRHGAVASFVGQVRDHDPEASGEVVTLEYSAHPDAPALIADIVAAVLGRVDPGGEAVIAAAHRTGSLAVGDLALVVAVGSAHRALALQVCSEVVEAVKHELPVWKRQVEADGSHVWSGLGC